jgi:hypothetical protein
MDDTQPNKLNVSSSSALISGTILISGITPQTPSTVITKIPQQMPSQGQISLISGLPTSTFNQTAAAGQHATLPRMTTEEHRIGGIRHAQLIELHHIGFKLVPLNDDGTPAMPWTPIYAN